MAHHRLLRRAGWCLVIVVAYFAIQSVIEVAHEFAHSGTAWLLGYVSTPFTVVWGNPITTRGWDEGVPYDALFPHRGNPAEAMIGGMPLLMHVVLLTISLLVLLVRRKRSRIVFFGFYLLAVMNAAELIAYIFMRPWIADGDTGRFNAGMDISPWPLFIGGSIYLVLALATFLGAVGKRLDEQVDSSWARSALAIFAGFIMFLWTSGLRMLWLYPDPQWKAGLVGIAGFVAWIVFDHFLKPRRTRRNG